MRHDHTLWKKPLSIFLALLLLCMGIPAAWALDDGQALDTPLDVTLRIELKDTTMQTPLKVRIEQYQSFASLGLSIASDPGVITPLHVLAAYFQQKGQSVPDNLTVTENGYVFVDKIGGQVPGDDYYWGYDVNGKPASLGMAQYPVQNGDEITVYVAWNGIYGNNIPSYSAQFAKEKYTATAGSQVTVQLQGVSSLDYIDKALVPLANASLLMDAKQTDSSFATTKIPDVATDANGNATFTAPSTPGAYVLSATRERGDKVDISRPYAILTVTEADAEADAQTVAADAAALSVPQFAKTDLTLPRTGASGTSGITWQSDQNAVLEADGTVHRPAAGEPAAVVNLTATIQKGTASKTRTFAVTVPPVDVDLSETDLYIDSVTLDSGTVLGIDQDNGWIDVSVERGAAQLTVAPQLHNASAKVFSAEAQVDGDLVVPINGNPTLMPLTVSLAGQNKAYTLRIYQKAGSLPAYAGQWASFRKNNANLAVTDQATPQNEAEARLLWEKSFVGANPWTSMGAPLVVGGRLYQAADDTLYLLDSNGSVVRQQKLAQSIGYFSYAAYGDGMLFVPLSGGQIQALNAETLESLWVTEPLGESMQAISPVVYDEGKLYTGFVEYISAVRSNGFYACYDVSDDITRTDEIKTPLWRLDSTDASAKGFYNAGGAIAGQYLLVGGDDGKLLSVNKNTGQIQDAYQATGQIRCAVVYEGGTLYAVTKQGYLYALDVNDDGTFANPRVARTSYEASGSAPVVAQGRLYVMSGDFGENSRIDVFDTATLTRLRTATLDGASGSSLFASTAYATADNGQKVLLYVTMNDGTGRVVCIEDSDTLAAPVSRTVFTGKAAYSSASVLAGPDGTLYFTNDDGMLYALAADQTAFTLSVDPSALQLAVGQKKQLKAVVSAPGAGQAVQWQSGDEAVAAVDGNGVVTAQAPGTASITATVGGKTATCAVTVLSQAQIDGGAHSDVKTGDTAITWIYAALLLLAVGGVAGCMWYKYKHNKK